MLYSIESKKYISDIPHKRFYDTCRGRLTDGEYDAIFRELDRRVNTNEIHTSSWIPGANWIGTVYQPIYDTACHFDEVAAAQFFGLVLWHVMLERPEVWAFGRYEKNNVPIEGLTYFQLGVVP